MTATRLTAGALGGLAGGVLFGILMQMMGMLGMVAGLVSAEGTAAGWVVHLAISVVLGMGYGYLLGSGSGSWQASALLGAGYGLVWWVVGALLLMPARMGMPVFDVGEMQVQSLMGHVVFGVALGLVAKAYAGSRTREPATT